MCNIYKFKDFKNGWIVGSFEPSLFKSSTEIAIHEHKKGIVDHHHIHKLCNEYNMVLDGVLIVNGQRLVKYDIFHIAPYQISDIEFLTDCRLLVIKDKSNTFDKYTVKL